MNTAVATALAVSVWMLAGCGRQSAPEPFPPFRSKSEWQQFLADLYNGWGQQWAKSGK